LRHIAHGLVCVGLVAIAGCGGAYPEEGSPEDEPSGTPEDYERRIQEMRARLDGMLGIAPAPVAQAEPAQPAAPPPPPMGDSEEAAPAYPGGLSHDPSASSTAPMMQQAPPDDLLADAAADDDSYSGESLSDCDVAADLSDRICELASRICRIAEDKPTDPDLQAMCKRATAACNDARGEVAAHCD
jgi:hypothetical protein